MNRTVVKRSALPIAAVAAMALALSACGSGDPNAVGTRSAASPFASAAAPSLGLTPSATGSMLAETSESSAAPDASSETIKIFAERVAAGDPAAQDLAAPGSGVALYAATAGDIAASNPSVNSASQATKSGNGWRVGDSVVLSDFIMTPDGLIADASRNGLPLSKIVAAGDGTVYTRAPEESYDDFTGQATFTIRAYRLFDNKLQVVIDVDNQSSADAWVSFDAYVAGGRQYNQGFEGDASLPTKPTVKRTVVLLIDAAPGGGTLTAKSVVDAMSSETSKISVNVPPLG